MKIDVAVCGIEGTGKTTAAKLIDQIMKDAGYSTRRVPFMQLSFNHFTSPHRGVARAAKKAAGFKEGVPMSRYDENLGALLDVKPTSLSVAYFVVFVFRVIAFRIFFALTRREQVLVFERYFYDNIAHKTTPSPWQRVLESVMLAITPKPKIVFFLTASCDQIVVRRPRISRDSVLGLLSRFEVLKDKIGAVVTIDTMRDVAMLDDQLRKHLNPYFVNAG
jgi:thymidylate kinase